MLVRQTHGSYRAALLGIALHTQVAPEVGVSCVLCIRWGIIQIFSLITALLYHECRTHSSAAAHTAFVSSYPVTSYAQLTGISHP